MAQNILILCTGLTKKLDCLKAPAFLSFLSATFQSSIEDLQM